MTKFICKVMNETEKHVWKRSL